MAEDYNDNDPEVRKKAMVALWNAFQSDPALKKTCTDHSHPEQARRAAWEALKKAGDFQDDPDGIDDVDVQVFDSNDRPGSDKLVTIVFPDNFDPMSFTPCDNTMVGVVIQDLL